VLLILQYFFKRKVNEIAYDIFGVTLPMDHVFAGKDHEGENEKTDGGLRSRMKALGLGEATRTLSNQDNLIDTRFSEFKLNMFKRRFDSEYEFPKTLDPAFAGVPVKVSTINRPLTTDGPSEKCEISTTASPDSPKKITLPPLVSAPPHGDQSESVKPLPFICTLCTKKFACIPTFKVMFKHVVTLRKSWDPDGKLGLVSKEILMLEQGTSMFNLLNICGFCSQFFDPEVDGGISYPVQNKKAKKTPSVSNAKGLGPMQSKFFDARYDFDTPPGTFLEGDEAKEFRAFAKVAIEMATGDK
jgi:hypothetical protein